ncbi:MAG: SDR family oxidoreductase [Solirubrobacterales bacterium]|nr:SDR family oxidoreductase [Solirubrobacterales bacterium]
MAEPSSSQVALVTGGSRGIGRACAVRLAADGFALVIVYSSNAEAAEEALAEIRGTGADGFAQRADVADETAMGEVFDRVEAEFGGVDAVVHAAGRMPLSPLVDLDLEELDGVHRTNIRGTFVVDQLAAQRLRDGGSIVNFSTSVVGKYFPSYGAYVASKGAVEGLTRVLANEMRGRDINVNAVSPGPTATELFLDGKSDEQVDELAHAVPLERLGQPGDIARVVAFLVSEDGHWINGQVVRANGGLV